MKRRQLFQTCQSANSFLNLPPSIIIKSKTYNAEEIVYKLKLTIKKTNGNWKTLPPMEEAIVFSTPHATV